MAQLPLITVVKIRTIPFTPAPHNNSSTKKKLVDDGAAEEEVVLAEVCLLLVAVAVPLEEKLVRPFLLV